jgi:hypothetical protein
MAGTTVGGKIGVLLAWITQSVGKLGLLFGTAGLWQYQVVRGRKRRIQVLVELFIFVFIVVREDRQSSSYCKEFHR